MLYGGQDLFDSLRGKFRALLNMLINLRIPYTLQNFFFFFGFCFMELLV
jgi:hypothetical protein